MILETELRDRCRELARMDPDALVDADAMIGLFQRFRPDGQGLVGLYDDLPNGTEYHRRLGQLYDACGDGRRSAAGRDAYFVVRQPPPLSPEDAESHANAWLAAMHRIAVRTGNDELATQLDPLPQVRVLIGTPPKQPKSDLKSFPLLRAIKVNASSITTGLASHCQVVSLLREAYYFTACDAMLRDYLLWPAYAELLSEPDPMAGYFELWRHGVKLRVFHDDKIDLYLPRDA
jgi:hypothetical protein